jgi:hypothetical protein
MTKKHVFKTSFNCFFLTVFSCYILHSAADLKKSEKLVFFLHINLSNQIQADLRGKSQSQSHDFDFFHYFSLFLLYFD